MRKTCRVSQLLGQSRALESMERAQERAVPSQSFPYVPKRHMAGGEWWFRDVDASILQVRAVQGTRRETWGAATSRAEPRVAKVAQHGKGAPFLGRIPGQNSTRKPRK